MVDYYSNITDIILQKLNDLCRIRFFEYGDKKDLIEASDVLDIYEQVIKENDNGTIYK